jgi:hypothetical protein
VEYASRKLNGNDTPCPRKYPILTAWSEYSLFVSDPTQSPHKGGSTDWWKTLIPDRS